MTDRTIAIAALALALTSGCGKSAPAPRPLSEAEIAWRDKLGVPRDARRVLLFGQNAHLDVDWQKTFDDYYGSFVGDIFTEARQILSSEPRAFYSVAEMAYLQHHLSAHPEELAPLRAAAARGALRIVGGGMTSPDTLLPEVELLARDYLYGLQFAEDQLGAQPSAAWLPDSFGQSATAPDVLAAAGFASVAFSRIDGAPTLPEALFHPDIGPKPGSTAALLASLGSADFIWQGAGGAAILAHFLAGKDLYCQGDNIDYGEGLQVPGGHIGAFQGDDPSYTDGKIDDYLAELTPYSVTPYSFIPVGCDFQHPKKQLIDYLDGYDARRYPETGAWAVAAPFDDYAMLVSSYRDELPTLSGELTPYFMGFYGTRAGVKRAVRDAARPYWVASAFSAALGQEGRALSDGMADDLRLLARTDHHDFVTGTANDLVATSEQIPLCAQAEQDGQNLLAQVASAIAKRIPLGAGATDRLLVLNGASAAQTDIAEAAIPIAMGMAPALHAQIGGKPVPMELAAPVGPSDTTATLRLGFSDAPPWSWQAIELLPGSAPAPPPAVSLQLLDEGGNPVSAASGSAIARVVLQNARVRAEWRRQAQFALTSLVIDGAEAIAAPSFAPRDYADMGGLWRLGNEMPGCSLTPQDPPSGAETVTVLDQGSLRARVAFVSASATREAALSAGESGLDLAITTGAAQGTTRTVLLALAVPADAHLTTSSPGGFVQRPLERVYSPTFWPAVAWAEVGGLAVLLRQSTGVRMSEPGQLELMAVRDARHEQCDIEGGTGSDSARHRIEWRIVRAQSAAEAERAAQAFDRPLQLVRVGTDQAASPSLPRSLSLATIDGDGVISTIEPATRGPGLVLRALLMPGPVKVTLAPALGVTRSTRIDLAQRDREDLGGLSGPLSLDPASFGSIASVRLQ